MIESECYLFANVNGIMDLGNYHQSPSVGKRLIGKFSIDKVSNTENSLIHINSPKTVINGQCMSPE